LRHQRAVPPFPTRRSSDLYTGVTAVTAGKLTVSDANGLGSTAAGSDTTVANSTLLLSGVTVGEAITLDTSSVLSGTGTSGTSGVVRKGKRLHTVNVASS